MSGPTALSTETAQVSSQPRSEALETRVTNETGAAKGTHSSTNTGSCHQVSGDSMLSRILITQSILHWLGIETDASHACRGPEVESHVPNHISACCHVTQQSQACASSGEWLGTQKRDEMHHGLEPSFGEEGSGSSGVEYHPNEFHTLHWGEG